MKYSFLSLLLSFLPFLLSAQQTKISAGLRGGLSLSHIVEDGIRPSEWHKLGVSGGLELAYHFANSWNVETALLYTEKGIKNKNGSLTNSYLELPIAIAYFSGLPEDTYRIKFLTGASFAQLLSHSNSPKDFYTKQDFAWLLGFGLKRNSNYFGNLQLEVRYQQGLKDIVSNSNDAFKNTNWTLHLIYQISLASY